MKRHYLVEPHVDDVYLSLHQHIIDWIARGDEVIIASVFSGTRNRAQDAVSYATAVGATWVGFGFDEEVSRIEPFEKPFQFWAPGNRVREEYLVYTPYGVEHPVHLKVHDWISADFHYLDIPYVYKDRNRHLYNRIPRGSMLSRKKATSSKEWFWKFFPDQTGFFARNPPCTYLDKLEVVVRPLNPKPREMYQT